MYFGKHALPLLALALAACGFDSTAPGGATLYLLRRIGAQPLPAPSYPSPGAPLIVADSLFLSPPPPRDQESFLVTRITVLQTAPGEDSRSSNRFQATLEGSLLTVDNCPIGSFCIASLVYLPDRFLIVGDSLFEQIPTGSPQLPRVYGRVRR
jgi:hypothetical protein